MNSYLHHIDLQTVRFSSVEVTARTTWTFAEISDREGLTEVVEISCGEDTRLVASLIEDSGYLSKEWLYWTNLTYLRYLV